MKHTTKTLVIGAALAGLLGGTAARAATTSHKKSGDHTSVKAKHQKGEGEGKDKKDKKENKDKHDCAGKNECKGQGGCKTGDNGCAGKNSCAGKGGCAPHKHDANK